MITKNSSISISLMVAVLAAMFAFLGWSVTQHDNLREERKKDIETIYSTIDKRLDRMEDKIDKILIRK